MGMSGGTLLSSATSQHFQIPTPVFSDGSWDMYEDFVGGLQFWGYALASGSGDGGVRMWDSEPTTPWNRLQLSDLLFSEDRPGASDTTGA